LISPIVPLNPTMGCPRSQKAADSEARVQQALAALSHKEFPNEHQAAKHFKVSPSTLR